MRAALFPVGFRPKLFPAQFRFRQLPRRLTLAEVGRRLGGLTEGAVRALIEDGPLGGRETELGLMVEEPDLAEFEATRLRLDPPALVAEPMGIALRGAPALAPSRGAPDVERLLRAYLAGRNEHTQACYARDFNAFRLFVGSPTTEAAASRLLFSGHGEANALALDYRGHLKERGLSNGSVNRHIASLRSLVKMARVFGMVPWTLEVQGLRVQLYRDTRGPGREGFLAMLRQLEERADAKAVRDISILRLLYERALRCNEVRLLDYPDDLDFKRSAINVLGKGRTEKEWLTIAPSTMQAIRDWLRIRGDKTGPLFHRVPGRGLFNCFGSARISRMGVYKAIREAGAAVGLKTRPHGLRHAAITDALDRGEPVRAVQRFSRHKDFATLLIYDDCREDLGGRVAVTISEPKSGERKPTPEPIPPPRTPTLEEERVDADRQRKLRAALPFTLKTGCGPIQTARARMNLTQRQLAAAAKLSVSTVHFAETGRVATRATLKRLATVLGCSVDELSEGDEP